MSVPATARGAAGTGDVASSQAARVVTDSIEGGSGGSQASGTGSLVVRVGSSTSW